MLVQHSSQVKKVFVAFHLKHTLRDIEPYVEEYFATENMLSTDDWLVIIVKEDMNESMSQTLQAKQRQAWDNHGYFISIFTLSQLQFDINEHKYVPPRTILSDLEKEKVKARYCIRKDTEFPTISRFDPCAQVLGMRPGEVCYIERDSRTAITSDIYRFCLN